MSHKIMNKLNAWIKSTFSGDRDFSSWSTAFGVKENEQHRQTVKESESSAAQSSNNSPGGASEGFAATPTPGAITFTPANKRSGCRACNYIGAFNYDPYFCDTCYIYSQQPGYQHALQQSGYTATQIALQQQAQAMQQAQVFSNSGYGFNTVGGGGGGRTIYVSGMFNSHGMISNNYPPHNHIDLKAEEIIAGELIGWRVWNVLDGQVRLKSITASQVWTPGEVIQGDVKNGYGVHSYKTLSDMVRDNYYLFEARYAYGEIELWGDVIEHEHGYRSEFASVKSINHCDKTLETKLREVYVV